MIGKFVTAKVKSPDLTFIRQGVVIEVKEDGVIVEGVSGEVWDCESNPTVVNRIFGDAVGLVQRIKSRLGV